MRKHEKERGAVSLLFLVIFVSAVIFGLTIYTMAVDEYSKSSAKIENVSSELEQDNILNSLFINYSYDIRNDIKYNAQKDYIQPTCPSVPSKDSPCLLKSTWENTYTNFNYEFNKESKDFKKEFWNSLSKGDYGTSHYMPFRKYNQLTSEDTSLDNTYSDTFIHEFLVAENWNTSTSVIEPFSEVNIYDFYREGALYTRNSIYIKVKFPANVFNINVEYGGLDDNLRLRKNLRKRETNRSDGSAVYELPITDTNGKALRIDTFIFTSNEGELETLQFGVLYARDIDIVINQLDPYRPSLKTPRYKTTIRVEQSRDKNRIYEIKN